MRNSDKCIMWCSCELFVAFRQTDPKVKFSDEKKDDEAKKALAPVAQPEVGDDGVKVFVPNGNDE